jgi:hypothetical protein
MPLLRSHRVRRALIAPVALGLVALLSACQPDLWIRASGSGLPYKGKGIINGTGEGQTETREQHVDAHALYDIRMENVTKDACNIQITDGALNDGGSYLRKYVLNGQNITARVTSPQGFVFTNFGALQKTPRIRLRVTPESGAVGNRQVLVIEAKCLSDQALIDRIQAITIIK